MSSEKVWGFRGEFHFLSNFWPCPVTVDGIEYPSSEHAFQALKTDDPEEREAVRRSSSAGAAKKAGRLVTLRSDWNKPDENGNLGKIHAMRRVLRAKFEDPDLRAQLLATGGLPLYEANTWRDHFWGVESATGRGHNWLGRLLMELRADLAAAEANDAT